MSGVNMQSCIKRDRSIESGSSIQERKFLFDCSFTPRTEWH
ncbi:hypothetical protein [Nostoc sp.]